MPKEDNDEWMIVRPKIAIVYVLRTGIQWNALPRELGASSTVHDRFQEWERADLFKAVWQAGLSEYNDLKGIQWEWQAVDGVMTKAPFAGAATGANPTDRGKREPSAVC